MNRTHNNGELRLENVGQTVELKGWVAKKRNLGALVFIDLRDRYGITQIIINEEEVKNEVVNIKCNHDKEQVVVPLENILAHIENHLSGGHEHE